MVHEVSVSLSYDFTRVVFDAAAWLGNGEAGASDGAVEAIVLDVDA